MPKSNAVPAAATRKGNWRGRAPVAGWIHPRSSRRSGASSHPIRVARVRWGRHPESRCRQRFAESPNRRLTVSQEAGGLASSLAHAPTAPLDRAARTDRVSPMSGARQIRSRRDDYDPSPVTNRDSVVETTNPASLRFSTSRIRRKAYESSCAADPTLLPATVLIHSSFRLFPSPSLSLCHGPRRALYTPPIAELVEPQTGMAIGRPAPKLFGNFGMEWSGHPPPPSPVEKEARQHFLCHSSHASASTWARR